MKTKLTLLMIVAILSTSNLFGQECCDHQKQDDQPRYNQYGVEVSRTKLSAEARDGILVFESQDQKYKLWFDNRVQVDGAVFFGQDKNYDAIGNGVSIRRARIAIKGEIGDWYGEVDTDFAN